jgi:uncharacterized protein
MRQTDRMISRVAWSLRPHDAVVRDGVRIADGRYVETTDGSKARLSVMFRVRVPEFTEDQKMDYSAALRSALQQQRMKGLFEGLRKAAVPFVYTVLLTQEEDPPEGPPVFEFDLVVGTWADGKKGRGELAEVAEQRANVLGATLGVALPGAEVQRLVRGDLVGYLKAFLLPGAGKLPQAGPVALGGALCSFQRVSPTAGGQEPAPDFYIPNSSEAGSDGILLGPVKSGSGEFHEFRLQMEDLRRHVCVLGMTGSGKSTTGVAIAKQAAEQGLPVMVLDWHNEYGRAMTDAGGKVVSPGRDDFSINPLEVRTGVDLAEHVATVADIFSDIYHFTHPQAYMFRNALQKRMSDTSGDEVPDILSLVKTIEAYPLRSAYDNETKVALLRRLVPLTQGQSGKGLGVHAPVSIEELLNSSVCVELGHMRDTQARAVFADFMLKLVYEEKVRRRGSLDHLTVVEEARNVAPARRVEDPPSVGERMISELRKFGEGMMFVAQFPSHIASEVVKNAGTKVVHRLAWPDDVTLMGDSLSLNKAQREYLTKLGVGEAIVGVARIRSPFLVQVRQDAASQEIRDLSLGAVS